MEHENEFEREFQAVEAVTKGHLDVFLARGLEPDDLDDAAEEQREIERYRNSFSAPANHWAAIRPTNAREEFSLSEPAELAKRAGTLDEGALSLVG